MAARSLDEELERLYDNSLDAVLIAGLDGFLRRANRGFARLLGYSLEELLARPFMDNLHPDDFEAVRVALAELAAGKDMISFECRLMTADGWVRWTEWDATPRVDEGVVFAVGRDVTERHLAMEQVSALRRIATLVAEVTQPHDLFALVASEVARVVDVPAVSIASYETDDNVVYLAMSEQGEGFGVGVRQPLDGTSVVAEIRRTHEPARIDDYSGLDGTIAEAMRRAGGRSTVGSPIVVAGRLWGAMVVSTSAPEPLPPDTEARLADFTELLGSAIANAESREALERLADEQAALRRVATLIAQGEPPAKIFAAVSDEVDELFACGAGVARFEDDVRATVFAGVSKRITVPIGTRFEFQDGMASVEVYRTHQSARVDRNDWSTGDGALATTARRVGLVSSVASPIVVDGHLWGTMNLWSTDGPLPPDTADRLEKFTDLVATAIANAEAREALERLAEEQAALRRVATLAAQAAHPTEIFTAVSREVAQLFGTDAAYVGRFEPDGPAIVAMGVANWNPEITVGMRWELDDSMSTAEVLRTGRSARVDDADWSSVTAPIGALARRLGTSCAVSSPITVDGRLWGAMSVAAREPLPPDTADRLEKFTALVATAIANAESREALERLAEEQATLRRVATLVARGVPASRIFMAVSEEVGQLFGENLAAVGRFDVDERAITCVGTNVQGLAVGTRVELTDETLGGRVYATGRSVRVDRANGSAAWPPMGKIPDQVGVVSAVSSPIIVEGRLWGAISALATSKPLPADTEERLERFGDLLATAIANAENKSELAASRRRIVAASDEARRRIERDLHDGTQQRLVALGLAVRAAEADVPEDCDDLRSDLSRIALGLTDAVTELQEMSRGIHPAILSKGGLASALRALARRSAVPLQLDIATDVRLPESIEVAAYYVASEAIANATKHAHASRIDLSLAARDGGLQLSVRDDGVGGADARRGSGLVGLGDRVEAVGGSIRVESPRGGGTHITAELPLDLESQISADNP
jgi:PAS domain S-box-containing protein